MKDVQPVHLALFVIFVLSWCGSLYSLYSAARRRRSGVSFSTASNFLLLCFRPDLYTQEGVKGKTTHPCFICSGDGNYRGNCRIEGGGIGHIVDLSGCRQRRNHSVERAECDCPGCGELAVARVFGVRCRRIAERFLYCERHIPAFYTAYFSKQHSGEGAQQRRECGVAFDIELLVYEDSANQTFGFSLREAGGPRRLDCRIGQFEAAALLWQLEGAHHPRPLTHPAMLSVISALGGRLECVAIDKFYPTKEVSYEAKLHLRQMNTTQIVDVRPSDAVVLAVTAGVPIFVADEVLNRLPA